MRAPKKIIKSNKKFFKNTTKIILKSKRNKIETLKTKKEQEINSPNISCAEKIVPKSETINNEILTSKTNFCESNITNNFEQEMIYPITQNFNQFYFNPFPNRNSPSLINNQFNYFNPFIQNNIFPDQNILNFQNLAYKEQIIDFNQLNYVNSLNNGILTNPNLMLMPSFNQFYQNYLDSNSIMFNNLLDKINALKRR